MRERVLREEWAVRFVKCESHQRVGNIRLERKVNLIW